MKMLIADGNGELMETAGNNAKTGGPEAGDVIIRLLQADNHSIVTSAVTNVDAST